MDTMACMRQLPWYAIRVVHTLSSPFGSKVTPKLLAEVLAFVTERCNDTFQGSPDWGGSIQAPFLHRAAEAVLCAHI
jgi:hypothetical protein